MDNMHALEKGNNVIDHVVICLHPAAWSFMYTKSPCSGKSDWPHYESNSTLASPVNMTVDRSFQMMEYIFAKTSYFHTKGPLAQVAAVDTPPGQRLR